MYKELETKCAILSGGLELHPKKGFNPFSILKDNVEFKGFYFLSDRGELDIDLLFVISSDGVQFEPNAEIIDLFTSKIKDYVL